MHGLRGRVECVGNEHADGDFDRDIVNAALGSAVEHDFRIVEGA